MFTPSLLLYGIACSRAPAGPGPHSPVLRQRLPLWHEAHRERVDAVARVLGGDAFAEEDVAEVAAAVRALDFDAHAIRVRQAFDGAGDFVVEGGPAAVGVELVGAAVEWRVAATADVGAGLVEVVVLAGEGILGALVLDDAGFFGREFVVLGTFHDGASISGCL